MLADVAVFPADIMRLAPADLLGAKTEMTIVGGKIVYESRPH
jgi:predicted amidohydrolase YtcJ